VAKADVSVHRHSRLAAWNKQTGYLLAEEKKEPEQRMDPVGKTCKAEIWAIEQLSKLGIDLSIAVEAIDQGVDFHEVERLVSIGCDPYLALNIVR
jgi:hypothetical protein